jgi:hypothetical protein
MNYLGGERTCRGKYGYDLENDVAIDYLRQEELSLPSV